MPGPFAQGYDPKLLEGSSIEPNRTCFQNKPHCSPQRVAVLVCIPAKTLKDLCLYHPSSNPASPGSFEMALNDPACSGTACGGHRGGCPRYKMVKGAKFQHLGSVENGFSLQIRTAEDSSFLLSTAAISWGMRVLLGS